MESIIGLLLNLLALASSFLLGSFLASVIFAHVTGRDAIAVWRRFLMMFIGRSD